MKIDTRIGTLRTVFDTWSSGLFPEFWTWKLDSYRREKSLPVEDLPSLGFNDVSDESQQIAIRIRPTDGSLRLNEISGTLSLLKQERSGFFFHQIQKTADQDILYQMVSASSAECILAYRVKADWSEIELLVDKTGSGRNAAFEYLSRIMPGVFLNHHLISIHSALIEYNGYSFALCADSGVGKTTRARLWRDYKDALILNGDRTICKRSSDGWTAYGTPWSGTSGEQINRSAPLRAMVILERAQNGEENLVQRLTPVEAFPRLLPHLQVPQWDERLVDIAFTELDYMLREIPIFLLRSHPDVQGVDVLAQALEELS